MSPRRALIIHPDPSFRDVVRASLPADYELVVADDRRVALEALLSSPPTLVISDVPDFRRLLRDLERHAPAAVRAAVCAPDDAPARRELVDVASDGYHFVTIDGSPASVAALVRPRSSIRDVPKTPMIARFQVGELALSCRIDEVGNDGLGLRVGGDIPLERLTPGTRLSRASIERDGVRIVENREWSVRTVRFIPSGRDVHVGVEFVPHGNARTGAQIEDEIRVRALLRRAIRRGATFRVTPAVARRVANFRSGVLDAASGRLALHGAGAPVQIEVGEIVQVGFEFGGRSYRGTAAVLDAQGEMIVVSRIRALLQHHRRSSLRIRVDASDAFALTFTSPLNGARIRRALLDLHPSGASFLFNAAREVLPPGLILEDVVLHLQGRDLPCRAVVQANSASGEGESTAGGPRTRRCGVQIVHLADDVRQVLLDALVSQRVPEVGDGSRAPFAQIWELFETGGVAFPDYQFGSRSIAVLERSHGVLGDGRHGLSKTFLYKDGADLHGHTSGLRIYSRTWQSQHLVVRTAYRRFDRVSNELVTLMGDYGEALPDVDYMSGMWRARNRWTSRVYGAIVGKMESPGLTALHSFTPCRLPVTAQLPLPVMRSRDADLSDQRAFLAHMRTVESVVRLRATDLVEGQLHLEGIGERYARQGLQRSRRIVVVDGRHGPRGWALLEDMTPGLFWAEWYNAFRLVLVDPRAPDANDVRRALVAAAVDDARQRGRTHAECLAADLDLPLLHSLGFDNLGKVMEWTCHRSMAREWLDHFVAIFERVTQSRAGARGGRQEPDAEAA